MHYELIAQCNASESVRVIREIERSGGKIRDILEDLEQEKLLIFIEYDDPVQEKLRWLDTLGQMVTQIGGALSFPTPAVTA